MKPTSFKETNRVLTAGGNPNTDQLAVCNATYPGFPPNTRFQISKWKLSEHEKQVLLDRGEIWISIQGHSQPPVLPMVFHPFAEDAFEPVPYDETPGPTGNYPEGKLNNDDQGELKIAIGKIEGKIVIDFGKPTTWIGMPVEQAVAFAELIVQKAVS